jgi:hypothetical protein
LIHFGSDTHGRDWTNSPLMFDVAARRWSRVYPNDERANYAVTDDGMPVAGAKGERPWAMFGRRSEANAFVATNSNAKKRAAANSTFPTGRINAILAMLILTRFLSPSGLRTRCNLITGK